jgi:hypothetical protein
LPAWDVYTGLVERILKPQETAFSYRPQEVYCMVHDLVLAVVFLSMIVAPALIAMRADNGEQDF